MAFASPPGFVPILPRGAACDLDTLATFAVPMPQNAPQHRRGKAKGKAKPMTSSERGIKFRQRQHERQITLLTDNQMLRQQVLRLQAMRDMYTQKSLSAPSSIGGTSPMSFVIEYFNQFRIGLQVPGAPAPILSSEKQKDFLGALIEPHTTFGASPQPS
ncbi:uncharacterized protein IUM83_07299 [Phytophthora cinnamomi]|uniref:uncharacterized protein n=1 Tax=Phytophthora cinnamomi TaxID=4785 RepID=UPI003559E15B|nr:hypothetical protein IUM83_07299 [Phytophthora cinnamomi]